MNPTEFVYFKALLKELTKGNLHIDLQSISLKEANLLSQLTKEKTGESISSKSLITYINAVNGQDPEAINPTNYTLNTLAHLYFLSTPAFLNDKEVFLSKNTAWLTFKQQLKVDDLKQNVKHKKQARPIVKILGIIILVTGVVITGFVLLHKGKAQNNVEFHDDFNVVHLDSLYARGWTLHDPDTTFIHKQSRPGHLTLYTLKGNYWVKANERPYQTNTLLQKINAKNFEVETKIDSFLPDMDWQQAGIFLINKNSNNINTIYFIVTASDHNNKRNPGKNYLDIILLQDKTATMLWSHGVDLINPMDSSIHNTYLKIKKVDNKYSFYYKRGETFQAWHLMHETELIFKNMFAGLSACHGQTFVDGSPLIADTLPVFYDYFSMKSLD